MSFGFQDPQLWLLLIPAGFVLWRAFLRPDRPAAALPFPDAGRAGLEPDRRTRLLSALPGILIAAAAVLLVAAMARPQRLRLLPPVGQEGSAIMLTIDTSGSMRALDFDPKDRMAAAKDAARDFIRHRGSDRIGVTVFADTANLQCPLTSDHAALVDYLGLVEVGMLGGENTAIGEGLITAVNHLRDAPGRTRTVILLTDGRSHVGEIDPITAAQTAKAMGIKVYAVGTATRGQALVPRYDPIRGRVLERIPDDLDEDTLLRISGMTGGRYFRAQNLRELYAVFEAIDRQERPPVALPPRVQRSDLYAWVLIPALLLLAAELALSRTWLLKLPS